jgi:hypothetical protein
VYEAEGTYYFKATDAAGNSTTITVSIDKKVRYTLSIPNGGVTTSFVTVKFDEDITVEMTLNGEELTTFPRFEAVGIYVIKAMDKAGNEETITFEILTKRVRELVFVPPQGFTLTKVLFGVIPVDIADNEAALAESGKYTITLTAGEVTYSFEITVDATPPEVTIVTKNGATSFSGLTKKDVTTAVLYKNGEVVEGFVLSQEIKDKGSYKMVLTDDLGNTSVYEFEVKLVLNGFSIVAIVFGSICFIALVVVVIRGRKIKAS